MVDFKSMIEDINAAIKLTDAITLEKMAEELFNTKEYYKSTVYLVGNGGSSATMSHLASDLSNLGIKTICLTDNIPALTAKTNDNGWDNVYVELVRGKIQPDDILIVASVNASAGASPDGEAWSSNLLNLVNYFYDECASRFLFAGRSGGYLKDKCTLCIVLDSCNPYIVESVHSAWAHLLAAKLKEIIEES